MLDFISFSKFCYIFSPTPPLSPFKIISSECEIIYVYYILQYNANACASNRTVPQGTQPLQFQQWVQPMQPNFWPGSQPTLIAPTSNVFIRGQLLIVLGSIFNHLEAWDKTNQPRNVVVETVIWRMYQDSQSLDTLLVQEVGDGGRKRSGTTFTWIRSLCRRQNKCFRELQERFGGVGK